MYSISDALRVNLRSAWSTSSVCVILLFWSGILSMNATGIVMQLVSNIPTIKEYFSQGDIIEFVCAILE